MYKNQINVGSALTMLCIKIADLGRGRPRGLRRKRSVAPAQSVKANPTAQMIASAARKVSTLSPFTIRYAPAISLSPPFKASPLLRRDRYRGLEPGVGHPRVGDPDAPPALTVLPDVEPGSVQYWDRRVP
jgi:hypothetical protein